MSKIKNGGLDQYGAKPFEQQQFGAAVVEGVNTMQLTSLYNHLSLANSTHSVMYKLLDQRSVFLTRFGAKLLLVVSKSSCVYSTVSSRRLPQPRLHCLSAV